MDKVEEDNCIFVVMVRVAGYMTEYTLLNCVLGLLVSKIEHLMMLLMAGHSLVKHLVYL